MIKRRGEKITAARDGTIGSKRKQREEDAGEEEVEDASNVRRDSKKPRGAGQSKREEKGKDRGGKGAKGNKGDSKAPESAPPPPPAAKNGIEKDGRSIGSLIGRKRRRKAGK